MEVITSHLNSDFDSFASMVAAKKLYPDAVLAFPGSQEKKVRDFIDAFHPIEVKRLREIDFQSISRLIIVDAKSPDRIGPFADVLKKKKLDVHVYDHHPRTESDVRASVEVIAGVGATVTIFVELLRERGIKPSPMEATIFALGIYEETGNLLFQSTTERDVSALAHLLKCGASLKIVSTYMKSELSREELDLLGELMQTAREMIIHGVKVKIAKASREEYFGDAALLAHKIMDMEDIDALVLLLRMEGKVVMVGRSRAPELNIAEVLGRFGGGGHPTAASAVAPDSPLEMLDEEVASALKASVKPRKAAGDIMTRPVITIAPSTTVKEAEALMTKYGVNVFPIVEGGKFAGIISREAVEKALFHGFRRSKVMNFATTGVVTAGRETSVGDIESAMIERNQRFVPVLDGDTVVGAITRTDLLRLLYEESLARSRVKEESAGGRAGAGKNLSPMMQDRFPRDVLEILVMAGEIARDMGSGAYLVGGSVRDLLRGEANLDLDIVVEGDGIAFSKELGERLGGRVKTHERFGTAKIIKGDFRVDVATARTEYYESPAALPTVEMSSIKKDLYRRDFTINTLAVRLDPVEFGQLVDFFGGQRDLKDKTIRVLHNLSFVEDPTRAFRAVRFSERFGFRLSKHTETLIKTAIKMSLFERLSGTRLYEELMLTFHESEPQMTLKRLAEYDLLKVIHNGLSWSEALESALSALSESLLWFRLSFMEEKPDIGLLYLSALISQLKDDDRASALKRLSATEKMAGAVLGCLKDAKRIVKALPLGEPARIYDLLSGVPVETCLAAMAFAGDAAKKKEISRYLLEWRKLKPILTGNDLKAMGIAPGPDYSRLLRAVLHERLRGAVKSKEDEERFIKGALPAK